MKTAMEEAGEYLDPRKKQIFGMGYFLVFMKADGLESDGELILWKT